MDIRTTRLLRNLPRGKAGMPRGEVDRIRNLLDTASRQLAEQERAFLDDARTCRHQSFAEQHQSKLAHLFPSHVCLPACRTCRFMLQLNEDGLESGESLVSEIRTLVQTFGHKPVGYRGVTPRSRGTWFDSKDPDFATLILGCFGKTIEDVVVMVRSQPSAVAYAIDLMKIVEVA